MSNPLEDLLESLGEEKTAGILDDVRKPAMAAATMGVVGAAGTAAALGAKHLINAATKSRDFKTMLEHNQDLAQHDSQHMVSMAFTTLRRFAPEFSKDPLVAGTYVRRIVSNPEGAGGIIGDAMGYHRGPGPIVEGGLTAFQSGLRYQDPRDAMKKDLGHLEQAEKTKARVGMDVSEYTQAVRNAPPGQKPPRPF